MSLRANECVAVLRKSDPESKLAAEMEELATRYKCSECGSTTDPFAGLVERSYDPEGRPPPYMVLLCYECNLRKITASDLARGV